MIICIPVEQDNGLQSQVSPHFGSAPAFVIVDTETGECRAIPNRNQHHAHGACMPLASLQGERIDGMLVGGIGMGALNKLNAANIRVYRSGQGTVAEAVAAFKAGQLEVVEPAMACAHHGRGHASGGNS